MMRRNRNMSENVRRIGGAFGLPLRRVKVTPQARKINNRLDSPLLPIPWHEGANIEHSQQRLALCAYLAALDAHRAKTLWQARKGK